MKKIFFDATALCRKRTGIENYTFHLLKALLIIDKENDYHIVFRKLIDPDIVQLAGKNVKLTLSPFKSQILTEQIFIPWIIAFNRFDISCFCCFPPSLLVVGKIITVCYDATNWRYKQYLSWKNRLYFKPLTENAIKRAKAVVTISKFSADEIIYFFPKLSGKPVVVFPSLIDGKTYLHQSDDFQRENLNSLGITGRFILCVGSLEPRKNVEFVIRNVGDILLKYNLQLVLTGRQAWGNNSIDSAISNSNFKNKILKTGFLSNKELSQLYRHAEMFLFPSFYEGFGLPILEAFACRCPVITSNVSSMPEVAGNAAIFIDPNNGGSLRSAVELLLNNKELSDLLVKKGEERLKEFSWEKSAAIFIEVLRSI